MLLTCPRSWDDIAWIQTFEDWMTRKIHSLPCI
jgi:hypothetical protein